MSSTLSSVNGWRLNVSSSSDAVVEPDMTEPQQIAVLMAALRGVTASLRRSEEELARERQRNGKSTNG